MPGERKGMILAEGRAHEDDELVKGGDHFFVEVDGRVEDSPDGTEEKGRERWMEDDWIWKIEVDGWGEGESEVEDGVVLCRIDGEWRQVPHHRWAWNPLVQAGSYPECLLRRCHSPFDCSGSGSGDRLISSSLLAQLNSWNWAPKVQLTFKLD